LMRWHCLVREIDTTAACMSSWWWCHGVAPVIPVKRPPEDEQSADPWWRSTDLAVSHADLLFARAVMPPPA
jgi:hypothetical protein